jgi:hypothetical protein
VVIEQLKMARSYLRAARAAALDPRPESLDACQPELEAALHCLNVSLNRLRVGGPDPGEPLAAEAAACQLELRQLRRLLEEANRFYEGWLRQKAALTAGYDALGQPAALEGARHGLAEG